MLTLNACNFDKESSIQHGADKIKVNETQSIPNISIDLKSPDNAVKSMWVVLEHRKNLHKKACEENKKH